MKERPILFSAPMVRALLDGSKTQTRRVVKPQPEWDGKWFQWGGHKPNSKYGACAGNSLSTTFWMLDACPYGKPGDRLWVRETWAHDAESVEQCRAAHEDAMGGGTYGPYYRATESAPDTLHWRPSIHMPRWASRITLEVTGVRIERLQDISEADAKTEGWPVHMPSDPRGYTSPKQWYAMLWNAINGPESWAKNPWVWVVEFKVMKP